jgi:hypothetical protein
VALLPNNENTIAHKLQEHDIAPVEVIDRRPYLGMSGIGHSCMRHLWYQFHWVSPKYVSNRMERLFNRGHWEEHRIIASLKSVGVECFRRDKDGNKIEIFGHIGEEQEEIIGFAGHSAGHNDGRGLGIPEAPKTEHLLEFKTANDKNFKLFAKDGVEKTSPKYFAQMQRYMKGLGLTRALFIVRNKNDESTYPERVVYDEKYADELVRKEQNVIMADMPPERIGGATWYECKMCDDFGVCHTGWDIKQNCRTCDKSDIENNGVWTCSYKDDNLSKEEQQHGCQVWKKGWGL